jgi:hypothetical protein
MQVEARIDVGRAADQAPLHAPVDAGQGRK